MNVQRAQKSSPAQLLNLLLHILIAGIAALLHGGIISIAGAAAAVVVVASLLSGCLCMRQLGGAVAAAAVLPSGPLGVSSR